MGLETAVAIAGIISAVTSVVGTFSSMSAAGKPEAQDKATPIEPEVARRDAEEKRRKQAMATATTENTNLTGGLLGQTRNLLGG